MSVEQPRDVVLVHGLWFRERWLRLLGGRLRQAGYRVHGFDYPSTRLSPGDNARHLRDLCDRQFPAGAHFVGHSLGGLLILAMLQECDWRGEGRVLCLGTPIGGSAVARRTASWPGASVLLGAARELLAGGCEGWPEGRRVGMIAGTRGLGLGVLAGGLVAPHDGTVAVQETRHPRLTDHLELPVTHTGMIYSRAVAAQVRHFLDQGRFEPSAPT